MGTVWAPNRHQIGKTIVKAAKARYAPKPAANPFAGMDPEALKFIAASRRPQPPPAPVDLNWEAERSGLTSNYGRGVAALDAEGKKLNSAYGVDASGNLDWTTPEWQATDPFSITTMLKRQFRQGRDADHAGAFSSGMGYDGSAQLSAAQLGQRQNQQIVRTGNDFNDARGSIATRKDQAARDYFTAMARGDYSSVGGFAADPNATTGQLPYIDPDLLEAPPKPEPRGIPKTTLHTGTKSKRYSAKPKAKARTKKKRKR